MTLTFGAATHKGKYEVNEDAVFARMVTNDIGVFAVVDGRGGKSKIASEIAIEAIEQHLETLIVSNDTVTALDTVVQSANSRIIEYGTNNEKSWGLGASITLAVAKQDIITIAQVGNTEGYEITADSLTRLTDIHDIVHALIKAGQLTSLEEAEHYNLHSNLYNLYRALGMEDEVEVDLNLHQLQPKSGLLLCTSLLTHYLSKNEIHSIITSSKTVQSACNELVGTAVKRNSANVSAVFISNQFEFQAKND